MATFKDSLIMIFIEKCIFELSVSINDRQREESKQKYLKFIKPQNHSMNFQLKTVVTLNDGLAFLQKRLFRQIFSKFISKIKIRFKHIKMSLLKRLKSSEHLNIVGRQKCYGFWFETNDGDLKSLDFKVQLYRPNVD